VSCFIAINVMANYLWKCFGKLLAMKVPSLIRTESSDVDYLQFIIVALNRCGLFEPNVQF
jgi:hypothetical protein